jgi:glucuronate isomerase
MKKFMGEDFLLETETAKHLYHEHAAKLPIIDYHCHLSPREIAEDKQFRSITELWLGGDHYKWRAMRANGVDERYITGNASDWEKFEKWAETVPATFRNPLYHWTHLELKTAFGIDELLNPESARRIYDRCNELLAQQDYSARGLMRRYNVEMVCTTDDPVDSLQYHQSIRQSGFETTVLPAWRPDKAFTRNPDYLDKLSEVSGVTIHSYDSLVVALRKRHDYFAENGCCIADHGLGAFPFDPQERDIKSLRDEAHFLFTKSVLSPLEQQIFDTALLFDLCCMNAEKGWVQQFHFGPLRNVNMAALHKLGPDTGFDTIGDSRNASAIAGFLNRLSMANKLTKTILYNLNPTDNTWVAAMLGNFQDGKTPGKMQMGSGWWFNDQLKGMEAQIDALSMQGLLSRFVGMLTDSRSFVSYPRHEYFRRLLCNILGDDVENGLIPQAEMLRVEKMVEDISYYNAKNYFNLK